MKAIGTKILIKAVAKSNEVVQEKSGLFLQPADVETYEEAVVVSVGNEIKADLEEGDTVLIYKNAGTEIKVDDEKFKVITVTDILVVR